MNLNNAIGAAITKGALSATRKPIAALRSDVAELKRQVADLKRLLRAVQKNGQRGVTAEPVADRAVEGKSPRIRPTGPMVRKLRVRLGLTQADLAKLIGVSGLTIWKWETAPGRIMLRNRTLAAFAKIRGISKQTAKKLLAGE